MSDGNARAVNCLNPDDPPTFVRDIAPLFGWMDVQCMKNIGLLLHNYEQMSDRYYADLVLQHLKGAENGGLDPRMPPDPREYWSDEDIALFEQWVACGCKEGAVPE